MNAVMLHIAKDMLPVYTVEKLGLIHMLKTFVPRYVLQIHNGECLKPEVGDRLVFLVKNV